MKTFNLYKYHVVVRWKYDTEYQTDVMYSIREYKSIEEIARTYHDRKVVVGFELIEPPLKKVIQENKIENWN